MIRNDIRIGDFINKGESLTSYKFIVDLYKYGIDFNEDVKKQYSMIRKYKIINEIVYDTDIYIIEKDLINDDRIAYPVTNLAFIGFGSKATSFNENLTDDTYKVGGEEVYDILYRDKEMPKKFDIADVPCDKLRIYHPHNKVSLTSIIYVDTQVQDVHFHLLCRPYNTYKTNAEDDFEDSHIRYSEYIDCYIPNIEWLLSGDAYYQEHISMIDTSGYTILDASYLSTNEVHIDDEYVGDDIPVTTEGYTYSVSNQTLSQIQNNSYDGQTPQYYNTSELSFFVTEDVGRRDYDPDEYAYLICSPNNNLADECYAALKIFSLPFRIDTLVDEDNNEMFIKRYLPESLDTVTNDYITWPLRVTISPYTYVDDTTYLYINDSNLSMNSDTMQSTSCMSLKAKTGFDDNGNHAVLAIFDFPYKSEFNNFREAYEYFYKVNLSEYNGIVEYDEDEDDEDDYVEEKQCGFVLRIYSDVKMTQKIAQYIYEIDNPELQLDDFAFQTAGMFERWEQLPSTLVLQCSFVDKWLGNIIYSNPITITEENFKYFINNTNKPVVDWDEEQHISENIYELENEMKKSDITFVDKITCTIRREAKDTNISNMHNNTKVLYKPIFYRTQDLQTITLQKYLTQNIGINLGEYMTKVESFNLLINNVQIKEFARNDIYVIFKVNANDIPANSGTYHITNQDDEYISSGNFIIQN